MTPLSSPFTENNPVNGALEEKNRDAVKPTQSPPSEHRWELLWNYVIGFTLLHIGALYGAYLILCGRVLFKTILCAIVVFGCTGLGTIAGVHRLWSHRSYSARLPVRIMLALFQAMGYQHNIFKWARDHRVHHKYADTDADPHNSNRGFFFSHIGWLLVRPHPEARKKLLQIDMSDIMADPVVRLQRRYFAWFGPLMAFVVPPMIPYYFWNESFSNSFFVVALLRHALWLHCTFLVNSVAHMYGTKPFDKNIRPVQNAAVALVAFGEGWHNYHHTFPWDYKASELGSYWFNFATAFIDACAFFGLTYNLKTVDPALVAKRGLRTGDGSKVFKKTADDTVVAAVSNGTDEVAEKSNGTTARTEREIAKEIQDNEAKTDTDGIVNRIRG